VQLSAATFRRDIAQRGALHDLMGRYAQTVVAQMMQSSACNALHAVQQRCARWLLMTHDRVHLKDFHLSHEFLAVMLGVQRPTISVVARGLSDAGLISYRHGLVRVLDRKGLERGACPCYAAIRRHIDRMSLVMPVRP
jgi:CRP-like cAMP-binding protein